MKALTKSAIALMLIAAISPAYAEYKFDDLQGPSGRSNQWMIISQANDTFGDTHTTAIDVSGDVITTGDAVLNVLSGTSENPLSDREINSFFVTAVEGMTDFIMNFRSLTLNNDYDVSTPNLALSTPWDEQVTGNELYIDTKTPLGQPDGDQYDGLWRSYRFSLERSNKSLYDSVAQYFYFQQNPTNTPSQGIPRPMVIANVAAGPADTEERSLKLKAILRDGTTDNSNIAAYDQFTWAINGPKTAGSSQWVFVPVDDLNIDNSLINYSLTTEVVNRSTYRYAAYNGNTQQVMFPAYWKFNLLRLHGSPNIVRSFQLAADSHIAPGLVTVYRRRYNVNETDKIPLRIYPIDDIYGYGVYALTMNHNILYGKKLGDTYKLPASVGGFNQLEVTAFQPRPKTGNAFYDEVASITGSSKAVTSPTSSIFTGSSIKRAQTAAMSSSAIQYFTVDQSIPGTLRSNSVEGILPLHIVFNIPLTLIGADHWNEMLRELSRHDNDANINDVFADYFGIYVQVESADGSANVWNLTEELNAKGIYSEQVKIFLDQDRGRQTSDTDRGLLTVNFIVMLMDGTRDNARPELSIVADGADTNYIVMRDGKLDYRWTMTFFIAPSDYFHNPDSISSVRPKPSDSSSSGSGGCSVMHIGLLVAAMMLIKKGVSFVA